MPLPGLGGPVPPPPPPRAAAPPPPPLPSSGAVPLPSLGLPGLPRLTSAAPENRPVVAVAAPPGPFPCRPPPRCRDLPRSPAAPTPTRRRAEQTVGGDASASPLRAGSGSRPHARPPPRAPVPAPRVQPIAPPVEEADFQLEPPRDTFDAFADDPPPPPPPEPASDDGRLGVRRPRPARLRRAGPRAGRCQRHRPPHSRGRAAASAGQRRLRLERGHRAPTAPDALDLSDLPHAKGFAGLDGVPAAPGRSAGVRPHRPGAREPRGGPLGAAARPGVRRRTGWRCSASSTRQPERRAPARAG